jgi:hypothetical protein
MYTINEFGNKEDIPKVSKMNSEIRKIYQKFPTQGKKHSKLPW